MIVRRLIALFVILIAVMAIIALRLAQLQIVQANRWQLEARTFIIHPHIVETTRGTIVDRLGRPVAIDTACYDLAIDYRAMSLDDAWIRQQALARMTADGITLRAERRAKIVAYKALIADQILGNPQKHIEGIAAAISRVCGISIEEVHARMDAIRARMQVLRQSHWSQQYDRNTDEQNIAAGAFDLDAGMNFKEEQIAHTIVPAISEDAAPYFYKHLDEYPGLVIVDSKRRTYPYGSVAAQTIGVMRRVNERDMEGEPFQRDTDLPDSPRNLHGYLPMDRAGGSGVESMTEATLRGSRGIRVIDTASDQMVADKSFAAIAGGNVQLTLDIELQKDLETALKDSNQHLLTGRDGLEHPIALVILNAADSKVLAMVSLPNFDLTTYDQHISELMHDETNRPLLNRVVQSAYPPGSTVKGLVATAVLTEKLVTPEETITCNGHLFPNLLDAYRCDAIHGPVQLTSAIEESCNIYFYNMGMRLGYDRLATWYRSFGFGSETGCGLAEEISGRAPTAGAIVEPDVAKRTSIMLGIGQGPIQVTPLQLASAYATLVRDGVKIAPRLVETADAPVTSRVPLAVDQLPLVRQGLFEVVNGAHGTARALRMNIEVAGKTGTATAVRTVIVNGVPTLKTDEDAWFVGYVPADHPKFVIAAIMEFGGHGGLIAAPMVKEAIKDLERHDYLPRLDVP